MENINNTVSFNFFEQDLVERVVRFQESDETSKNENKEALKLEIKNIYKQKDLELKQVIANELVVLKEEHYKNLTQLSEDLVRDLDKANKDYEGQTQSNQYKEVVIHKIQSYQNSRFV